MRKPAKRHRTGRHHDVAAAIKLYNEDDLPDLVGRADGPALLLILDQVQDPHNLGACLRTADGAGATAVVIPKDRSAPMSDTTRRIASGAAENIPLVLVTNLARTLEQLKADGLWVIGTADAAEGDLYQADFTGPVALVMGAEGKGLRRLTAEKCDMLIRIPMLGGVNCLNVSVAAGVCLYEALRQRRKAE